MTTITNFGVKPDTGLDQTARIQAAINSCEGELGFPNGTYLVSSLTGKSNIRLKASGRGAILHSDSSAPILSFANCSRFSVGDGLILDGSAGQYPSVSDTGQKGILIEGCSEFKISANITRISGSGIVYSGEQAGWFNDADFSGFRVANCYRGVQLLGEFARLSNFTINRCPFGIDSDVGNQIIANGHMLLNSTAIKFSGGTNDGHSLIQGVLADHNNYALVTVGLLAGLTVNGCQFDCDQTTNAGLIAIYNSRGVVISGSQLGANLLFDGSDLTSVGNRNGANKVVNCYMRTEYTGSAAPSVQSGAVTPFLKDNFDRNGPWAHNN